MLIALLRQTGSRSRRRSLPAARLWPSTHTHTRRPLSSPPLPSPSLQPSTTTHSFHHHPRLHTHRTLTTNTPAAATTTTTTDPATAAEALERRLHAEESARKEDAAQIRNASLISDSLTLLRSPSSSLPTTSSSNTSGGTTSKKKLTHRQALLNLGHYAEQLAPADAVKLIHQALDEPGLAKVAFTALKQLRVKEEGVPILMQYADGLVKHCCRADKYRMAMMIVEDVHAKYTGTHTQTPDAGASPSSPPLSRGAYLSLLRLLSERNRFKDHSSFAEAIVTDPRFPTASQDVEVVAAAMIVAWKAATWPAIQRLLRSLTSQGVLVVPFPSSTIPSPPAAVHTHTHTHTAAAGDSRTVANKGLKEAWLDDPSPPAAHQAAVRGVKLKDKKTLICLQQVVQMLEERQEEKNAQQLESSGGREREEKRRRRPPTILHTDHYNILLKAYIRAGKVEEAHALLNTMCGLPPSPSKTDTPTHTHTHTTPLPPPDAYSLSLVMDALGHLGRWQTCLHLLNAAPTLLTHTPTHTRTHPHTHARLSATDHRMLYKTAIAALGKQGLWPGALSLFYEMHEKGIHIDQQVYTTLLKAFKKGDRLDSVLSFLQSMKEGNITPSRATYNVIFSTLGQGGLVEDALKLFEEMKREEGLAPSLYDYGTLISACGKTLEVMKRAGEGEDDTHAHTHTHTQEERKKAIVAQARQLLEEAEEVAEGMKGRKRRSRTYVGAARRDIHTPTPSHTHTQSEETTEKESQEKEGEPSPPHTHTHSHKDGGLANCYLQLLKVYGQAGHWEDALTLLHSLPSPSFSHYYETMRACAFAQQHAHTLALLHDLKTNGARTPPSSTTLIHNRTPTHPHILCWNAAIFACQQVGEWTQCLTLLDEMQTRNQEPGNINYARTMQACGENGHLSEALSLYTHLKKRQWVLDRGVYGALILACGKAQNKDMIHTLLNEMRLDGGLVPDRLNVAQAVAALALECGDIEAGKELVLRGVGGSGGGLEKEGDGVGLGEVDGFSSFASGSSSLLAFHVLLVAVLKHGNKGGSKKTTTELAQELLDSMMETHGLCPTAVTKVLLQEAGVDVSTLFVEENDLHGGGRTGGGGIRTLAQAEAQVRRQIAVNPHDQRKRNVHIHF